MTHVMERIIEHTADGSATLYVPELDEHYHSVKGAFTESQHIFIDMGLKACPEPDPHILEVGFGTGLNALLSLLEAERSGRTLHYTALELYPLPWETINQLGYVAFLNGERLTVNGEQVARWFEALHTAPWEEEVEITPHFTLYKVQTDFTNDERLLNDELSTVSDERLAMNAEPTQSNAQPVHHSPLTAHRSKDVHRYSLIYFDAFAPEKQPEMWTQELFDRLYVSMKEGGVLTTYCAKGAVRRMLQAAGFVIERLPGPPGGKREILRGNVKQALANELQDLSPLKGCPKSLTCCTDSPP